MPARQKGRQKGTIVNSASRGSAAQRVAGPATSPIIDAVATIGSGGIAVIKLALHPALNSTKTRQVRQIVRRAIASGIAPPRIWYRHASANRAPSSRTSATNHAVAQGARSEEHTSELQSLMRISYAVFCLKKKKNTHTSTVLHL